MGLRRADRSRSRATCHDGHAIGLDIGATSVRAAMLRVVAEADDRAVVVDRVAQEPLAPGIVVGGVVTDPAALTAAIGRLWRTADFGCRNVVLGVASPQVLVRELTMPDLPAAQRERALPFQARDVVAMPMDEVVLDFTPLEAPNPDNHQVRGLLVASPRSPVLAAVRSAQDAKLTVIRVDLSSLALLRSTAMPRAEVEAVVDLGAHLTTIVIHHHGVPRLVRTLASGGDDLTEALCDGLGLGRDEAETLKCSTGLEAPGGSTDMLREAITPLLSEIRSSLNYFRSGHTGAQIERIALTGGAARLPGLAQALTSQTGVPTVLVSPWDGARHAPGSTSDFSPATALSVGLAIGAAA